MKVPTPHECGLPDKFCSWRPKQEEALDFLLHSPKRIKALCGPTGFGKTAVYMAYAMLTGVSTCIVTDSKGLQNQLMGDFSSIGLVDIRGRRNYKCDLHEEDDHYTCEEGYAARCPYKGTVGCPSSMAEMRAATSRLVVTNYDKWTASKKYGKGMDHFQQIVLDEGHQAPDALARAVQVVLHAKEIERTLGVPFLSHPEADDMLEWRKWASDTREVAECQLLIARSRLQGISDAPAAHLKHYTHLRHLTKRLARLSTAQPADWIVEETHDGYQFDPIRPGRYAESSLLLRIPSILITSATLRPKSLYLLGIGKDHFDYREFDSEFDPRRCPIYYLPTMRVDARAESLSPLWLLLDRIMARRRDRKGIVQTVSYVRRDDIITASRFRDTMLVNERGEPVASAIDEYRQSGAGTTLVSPSVSAGYDFPMTDCEWQFVCKIPFPPPSKILKARTEDDPEYPYYLAMSKLVQIFGRGMRSAADRCENFIGDEHLDWFKPRYGHLAPRSFKAFFKKIDVLPPPPEKLS